jgi:hypothetical protein
MDFRVGAYGLTIIRASDWIDLRSAFSSCTRYFQAIISTEDSLLLSRSNSNEVNGIWRSIMTK